MEIMSFIEALGILVELKAKERRGSLTAEEAKRYEELYVKYKHKEFSFRDVLEMYATMRSLIGIRKSDIEHKLLEIVNQYFNENIIKGVSLLGKDMCITPYVSENIIIVHPETYRLLMRSSPKWLNFNIRGD